MTIAFARLSFGGGGGGSAAAGGLRRNDRGCDHQGGSQHVRDVTTMPSPVQGAKPEGNVSISSAFDKTIAKVRSANADRRPLDLADLRPLLDPATFR